MPAKHHVLVVGAGSIGERHARCFLATDRARVSICETSAATREQVAGRYPIAGAFADLDAALRGSYDAAVIATPAPLHIPMAIRLAESGLHLLIEKPLSTSLDGVGELRRILGEKRLRAAVGYVWRAHPGLLRLRQLIQEGRIGRPVELVTVCGQNFPTYRPTYREIYYSRREQGGGAMQDALTHLINAGEWLLGPVSRLTADLAHQVLEGVEVEDTAHVLTRQAGALGSYALNQYQAPNEITVTAVGDRGTARFESHRNRVRYMERPETSWREEWGQPVERDELFIRQATSFLDLVAGEAPPLCSLEEGIQTLKVNLAALDSAERGRWVVI
jgi:predicted dehydrogenase